MIRGFQLARRTMMVNRAVMEAALGERAAEPFVEEEEEQGYLDTFRGKAVGVSGSIALQQPVAFELAHVVAQLVETVAFVREVEGGEDGLMDLVAGPTADVSAAVQEDFEEANDARVLDPDAGIANRADGNGKRARTASRWSNPFLSWKSAGLLETSSLRNKVANFSYCLRKAFLK
jgi:hypothetical protein